MRRNASPRQIEAVGIPARKDGGLGNRETVAVKAHCFAKMLELPRSKIIEQALALQVHGEVGRARAVLGVKAVVVPLAVMQEREPGKDARIHVNRGRQHATVVPNPTPMGNTVYAVGEVEAELRAHDAKRLADEMAVSIAHDRRLSLFREGTAFSCGEDSSIHASTACERRVVLSRGPLPPAGPVSESTRGQAVRR